MKLHLKPLNQQVIVITGGSSGIGVATARMAVEQGARVALISRNEEALAQIEQQLSAGERVMHVVADVGEREQLQHAADQVIERFGGFDTWINNAGSSVWGRLGDVSDEDHQRVMQTNFWGTFYGSSIAAAHLRPRGGSIINIGSLESVVALPFHASYSASKHAVKALTDVLRLELEQDRAPVSVTLVRPVATDTPLMDHSKNELESAPNFPPPVYAPEVVAQAILHAAEHPQRDVYIGNGKLLSRLEQNAPRLVDWLRRRFIAPTIVSGRPDANRRGQLHEADSSQGGAGHAHGAYPGVVLQHSLYTRADTAMYQAKAEGKCMAVAFSNELEQRNERIRLIEDQLRALDGDDQLRLVYMPALNRDGAVVSCEVLLRWHSPVLGTVSPAEFIPIAERAGLFPKIDSWVIDHALAEYPQLVRLFGEQVILAINVSSAQLADDRICRYLAERAAHHRVAPGRIEIELTETYAAELNKDTMAVVQAIRRAGFRVAIDDFGVGYTSIQQLLEYPADTIKLDMAIITRLTRPDMQHSLSALVAFCHAQGKRVNAEGVDDMEKQSALLQAGCDLFQGYLISPPRALPALEDWMAVRNRAQGALRLEQLAPRVVPQPL